MASSIKSFKPLRLSQFVATPKILEKIDIENLNKINNLDSSISLIQENMNKIEETLPRDVTKTWDDLTKQYYVQYTNGSYLCQMWVEDINSIKEKLNLINQYELAGGAYWEKDRETQDIWVLTKEKLSI